MRRCPASRTSTSCQATLPRLVYLKAPAPGREPRLSELVDRIRDDDSVAYKTFATADELAALLRDDLAVLLGERFLLDDAGASADGAHPSAPGPSLPHPVSSLLGRDAEVDELADLLSVRHPPRDGGRTWWHRQDPGGACGRRALGRP